MFTARILLLWCLCVGFTASAQLPLFDQQKVNTIQILVDNQDSINAIYTGNNVDYHFAKMIYTNGVQSDTIDSVGIRIRGNTSLVSKKKSFKISFNEYVPKREYKGVRKLNLIGNHNDPTYVREKLYFDCYNKAGLPPRRVSFVKLYINNTYFGLMSNCEELDKRWLKDHFTYDDGNLYKCYFGADLTIRGNNTQNDYKYAPWNNQRVYELTTNETADNYTDLRNLITTINANPTSAAYLSNLDTIFNIDNYLKIYALDVCTGHWDSYHYNSNNFYLYRDSITDKFHFLSYDTDNTFGIDWYSIDWATRSALNWGHPTAPRPLVKNLMSITSTRNRFLFFVDSINRHITNPDSVFAHLDSLRDLCAPHVAADSFKTLDYGYTLASFLQGFAGSNGAHAYLGIKPFLSIRHQKLLPTAILDDAPAIQATLFPNPTQDKVFIQCAIDLKEAKVLLYNAQGKMLKQQIVQQQIVIDMQEYASGTYYVELIEKDHVLKSWLLQKQ
jgi:hypothetical protein